MWINAHIPEARLCIGTMTSKSNVEVLDRPRQNFQNETTTAQAPFDQCTVRTGCHCPIYMTVLAQDVNNEDYLESSVLC